MIATELVVILSFLARFKLDRDLADLNEAIAQRQSIIESYADLEENYRAVAARISLVSQLQQGSVQNDLMLQRLAALTPLDVSFSTVNLGDSGIELQGSSGSERGLVAFLRAMRKSPQFTGIAVTQISSSGEQGEGISFRLTAKGAKK